MITVVVVPGIARCRLCRTAAEDAQLVRVRVFHDDAPRDYSICTDCIARIRADHGPDPAPEPGADP